MNSSYAAMMISSHTSNPETNHLILRDGRAVGNAPVDARLATGEVNDEPLADQRAAVADQAHTPPFESWVATHQRRVY